MEDANKAELSNFNDNSDDTEDNSFSFSEGQSQGPARVWSDWSGLHIILYDSNVPRSSVQMPLKFTMWYDTICFLFCWQYHTIWYDTICCLTCWYVVCFREYGTIRYESQTTTQALYDMIRCEDMLWINKQRVLLFQTRQCYDSKTIHCLFCSEQGISVAEQQVTVSVQKRHLGVDQSRHPNTHPDTQNTSPDAQNRYFRVTIYSHI